MRTDLYRVRRTWFGRRCILQAQFNGPAFLGGQVDASIRVLYWADVDWESAPPYLIAGQTAMSGSPLPPETSAKSAESPQDPV